MPSLSVPVRAAVLFVAVAGWLMAISAILGSDGLDEQAVVLALQVAGTTTIAVVGIELGLVRRRPVPVLPALGVGAAVWCLAVDLAVTQVDSASLVVALGYAVIVVALVGLQAWWTRTGRHGLDPTG